MIITRPAKREEAVWLSSRLRSEDVSELRAASSRSPLDALLLSLEVSRVSRTMRYCAYGSTDTSTPFAMYGVADDPQDSSMGVVWLLSRPLGIRYRLALMKAAPRLLVSLSAPYERGLHNIVDPRNTLHVRWLQRTGFIQAGTVEHNGHQFIHAVWYKNKNV